jgi:Tol biopolymer transport system component/subtilisin-like proprotein convertase family protein
MFFHKNIIRQHTVSFLVLPIVFIVGTSSFAGMLNDYNPYNYTIPDNDGTWVSSDLLLSGAPAGAAITKVKIYYEIRHTYPGDLDVWLTYYDGSWHDYYLYHTGDLGGTDDIVETRDNLHYWDGASPNQTWYLVVKDNLSADTGYIDFFELWVTYNVPPNPPSSPDPEDGENNVSRASDLDWNCSDPDGDTIYYTVYFEKNDSSPDNIVKNDSTGSYADPGTLDYSSHYYWNVKADDHKGGVTLGDVWDFYTESNPNGNLDVSVKNFNGIWPGGTGRIVLYRGASNWQTAIGGDGIAHFTDKPAATDYSYEVYYDGARGEEYWGDKTNVSVVAGTTTTNSFTRFYPYATSFILKNDSTDEIINPGDPIVLGTIIRAEVTVYNGLAGQALDCFIQTLFDRDSTEPYDGSPTSFTLSVPAQNSRLFTTTFTPDQTGVYSKALKVTSVIGSGPKITDGTAFDLAFSTLSITGRIAYHSYTSYNSMDGILQICEMPEQNVYNIPEVLAQTNHQMNPHFSPDGSLLTFMAVPMDSPAVPGAFRSYLEVYIYDFTTGTVLRLTDNTIADEDPKFSPNGAEIVFKQNDNIYSMDIDGTNVQALTDTITEESGPYYSPNGNKIAYWIRNDESAEIWWMNSSGTGQEHLIDHTGIQDMYPIFKNDDHLLYTRWRSMGNHDDDIYLREISTEIDTPATFNSSAEEADAFPVIDNLLILSSDREVTGDYDLYIGDFATGQMWLLNSASIPVLDELGGCYTSVSTPPSTRTVTVESSPSGAPFTIFGVGSNEFEYTGTTPWSNNNMQPGHYTVNWGDLDDYNNPSSDTQYLVSSSISFIGNYSSLPPVISVTPASQDFGSMKVGSYADLTFSVENTGGGTLIGEASVLSPFSIVSGGQYNLTTGQTQDVTVRFSPLNAQYYSENVTFSGGGGTIRLVAGTGTLPVHTISAIAHLNGTIDPNGMLDVNEGEDQHFTATPDDGYMVDWWYLDSEPNQMGGTTYTLYNIQSDHTVEVTFKLIPPVIYVDADAIEGANNGSSWDNAFIYLQDALSYANSNFNVHEIWVAHGIYRPDETSADPNGTGDREATFLLVNGVSLKGGYAGFGELDPNARDFGLYQTILSGDINVPELNSDNSYHVVTSSDANVETVLDGFTITAGNADGLEQQQNRGAGMLNFTNSDPTVVNCTFINNLGDYVGGGMFNYDYSDPTVINCTFNGNSVDYGGGMCNWLHSAPTVTDCIFIGNIADGMGGGMFNHDYSEATISNCTFKINSGNWDAGGGMCNNHYSNPTVTNCIFSNNSAMKRGGGIFNFSYSNPTIRNCTFSGNSAIEYGGGMYNIDDSTPTVTNCIFWGDFATTGTEIYDQADLTDVAYSNVQGGWEGIGNINTDPCFADPSSGDYHLKAQAGRWDPNSQTWVQDNVTSPCIDAGNPGSPLIDEPNDPNNLRINMGAYGGTSEASNAPENWSLLADLTNDGIADFHDFAAQSHDWQITGDMLPGDLNRDWIVDLSDVALFIEDWLKQTSWTQL